MNALLASVRQIGRDLIDKRLWPVAVLLLVALAAVPVLIGGSSNADPPPGIVAGPAPGAAGATPPATAGTTGTTGTTGQRAGTRPAASKSEPRGKINDPFFDPPAPPSEAGAAGGGAGGAGARAVAASPTGEAAPRASGSAAEAKAPASASGSAKATTPSRTAPSTAPRVTPAPTSAATASYLRTVVRVNGAAGGKAFPMSRLTPLGGATDPAAVFLGVAKAGARYAVFVLGPHATSRGPATCKGDTDCRMIGLRAGQTQVVTVRRPSGAVRRFTLRVQSIRAVGTSAARARAARARIHADGRAVLRDLRRHAASAAALRTARYDARAGLLRAARARPVKNAAE